MPAPEEDPVERWSGQLAAWAIPTEILAGARSSPWGCESADFAVGATTVVDTPSSAIERATFPPGTGGSVLDVGCGGGRASMPLAPPADLVVGVDESQAMLDELEAAADRRGVALETHCGRWPDIAASVPLADLVICHHVAYNVADIVPFLTALTAHTRSAVVVELTARHPQSAWNDAWRQLWGVDRPEGPTADDLVSVVRSLGWAPEVWHHDRPAGDDPFLDRDRALRSTMRRLCLPAERSAEVAAYLEAHPLRWPSAVVTIRWVAAGHR